MNFKTYADFLVWACADKERLKLKIDIYIEEEPEVFYTSVMECFRAHEEGGD